MKKKILLAIILIISGAAGAQTIHLSEDFESGIPGSWTQTTLATDGGWIAGTTGILSSQFWPLNPSNTSNFVATNDDDCNCDKSMDRLITPAMDFTGQSNVFLVFDLVFDLSSYGGATETATIEYSIDGGTSWNVIHTISDLDPATQFTWVNESVDISAVAGMSNVLIAFHFNDDGGWLYGFALDNMQIYSPLDWDGGIASITTPTIATAGSTIDISGEILNQGANTITSIDLTYNAGAGDVTENISVNILPFGTESFTHTTPLNLPTVQTYTITVSVTNPNGNVDGNTANNSQTFDVAALTIVPTKMVFGEVACGTWNQFNPRGADFMDYMDVTYGTDSWAGVSVHNGDPMTNTIYDAQMAGTIAGYPSGHVDRMAQPGIDPSNFEAAYNVQITEIPPADIDVDASYNAGTGVLDITITATFAYAVSSDLRLNAIITEDHVTGTGTGWDQVNFYSGQVDPLPGFGLDWDVLPNPVPAADLEYNHVAREITGGFYGVIGSVPGSVIAGQVVTYSTSYIVPSDQNLDNIEVIGLLHDATSSRVLNAGKSNEFFVGVETVEAAFGVEVFPNPSSDFVNVRVELPEAGNLSIEVLNVLGQPVSFESFGTTSGSQYVVLDLTNYKPGVYHAVVVVDGFRVVKSFNVIK
ncbi:MAG: T9SS type A sorting domain-containing protein [Crocinitomicaceae bacterium]|nr:T9SS type A sorting domain-containing protein [Crocinitomicaceae bacterium]